MSNTVMLIAFAIWCISRLLPLEHPSKLSVAICRIAEVISVADILIWIVKNKGMII